MSEKIRVLMGCEIPELMDLTDLFSIEKELNFHMKTISPLINLRDLNDWSILIYIVLRSTNGIGIYKRIKRHYSNKEFEISISMTIPDDGQIEYGTSKVKEGFYLPMVGELFYFLKPNFNEYHCLRDYILCSAKSAIELAFQNGFTCNGKKLKFQKISN
ncbi:hypothetical protein XL92_001454 [Salmonella enterica subsp. enterica]|nr:hypothetical protein [Salmonella enterica subsp. enterica]